MKQKLSIQEIIRREKRRQALGTEIMCDWDFAHDNMENPELTRYARNYVKYFPRFRAQGAGLLLYGGPGSGKSYAAAEIVNALTDQGYRCLFTSLLSILSELASLSCDSRRNYLSQVCDRDLLALDDFATEAENSYTNNILLQVINTCRLKRVPLLVTTPCHPDTLTKGGADSKRAFIVRRLLSRCKSINVIMPGPRCSENFHRRKQTDALLQHPECAGEQQALDFDKKK